MPWLLIAISAYFLLAVASLGDRFLLVGPLPKPKVFAFFIGIFSTFVIIILFPFGFSLPEDPFTILLSLTAGFIWIVALVAYFEAIFRTEVSRVVPAVGAFVPIFTFLAISFLSQETLSSKEGLAFALLIVGGVLITTKEFSLRYFFQRTSFPWIILAAFLFALGFILMKEVFLREPFINGFIWIRLGGLPAAALLLFFSDVRQSVFQQKIGLKKQVFVPFLFFQSVAGGGMILQSLSVSLAKFSQVPLVNALEGSRYLFLFIFVWLLAKLRPRLLKEEMRGKILFQKIAAGTIIILGILFLSIFNN